MLQSILKEIVKRKNLSFHFTVNDIEETANQDIRNGHQINNAVINPFSLAVISFTF